MDLSATTFTPSKYLVLPSLVVAGIGLQYTMPGGIIGTLKRIWGILRNDRSIEEEFQNKAKEYEADIRRLENAKRVLEEEKKALAEEIRKLKVENARLSDSIQRANEENARIQKTVKQERESKDTVQRSLEKEQKEGIKARAAHQEEVGTLKRQLDVRKSEVSEVRTELQRSQTKLGDITALLETRTRELKGAQAFLTTADAHSGAEVIALLDALNAEVMQTCAFISDSFDFARRPEHANEIKEACSRISELMGPTMTHLLSTVQHSGDPLLVQIALQGAMIEFSRWIIMTWDYDGLQAEQPLAEIYNDIRTTETQAIGGRWRALTRVHAQKIALQQQDDLHSTMVTHISDTLVVIMVAAGCTKNYDDAYRHFTQKFGERVSNVVKMAVRLNKVMGEEVSSADLWPTHAAAGDKFDEVTMEDFEGQDNQAGKLVLCTTALGLYRSEKVIVGDSAEFKNAVLKRPKVALESVADSLEQEDASS